MMMMPVLLHPEEMTSSDLDCSQILPGLQLFPQVDNIMADIQEDMKLYLQDEEENFTFGGRECTLWTRVLLRD